jgi:hypothetical protein
MQPETVVEKPKRVVSEELKAKMRAGRERAAAERKAKGVKREARREHKELVKEVKASVEFMGITMKDCPIDCTPECCVIAGSLVMKNDDGTTTLVGHCGHPCKGGLQPIHQINRVIVERYNRARKHLAHVELDKRP